MEAVAGNGKVLEPIKELPPVRILIGVSILSYSHEFVQSFLNLWTQLCMIRNFGRKLEIAYKFAYRRPVHMAQEELAQFAIETGCTHVLLMDDDIYDVTVQDVQKLVDADKDVIGGIMFTSKFPHAMCAFRRYDIKTRVAQQPILDGPARLYELPPEQCVGVQPCDLIPFGLTLIKTSVFDKIEKPWFRCDTQAPTDSWFMDSILDAGITAYAHFDVWLNHAGCNRVTRDLMIQIGMKMNTADPTKVIQLSQEEMRRHMLLMDLKMKDAEVLRQSLDASKQEFINLNAPLGNGVETPELKKETVNALTP